MKKKTNERERASQQSKGKGKEPSIDPDELNAMHAIVKYLVDCCRAAV